MARKTFTYTVADEGRDKGKTYIGTEMPAAEMEAWGLQAFFALARAGVDVPEDLIASGMAGIAQLGIQGLSGLNFADAKPLFDRLMDCVVFQPDPRNPQFTRALIDDDIEEWQTRLKLRWQVFKLHVDFSAPAVVSSSTSPIPAGSAASEALRTLPRASHRRSMPSSPPTRN